MTKHLKNHSCSPYPSRPPKHAKTWTGHREILMDIADLEGDREAGVRTLPVLLGRETALALAATVLTIGVGAAGVGIVEGEVIVRS